jgi:hypothetical protein
VRVPNELFFSPQTSQATRPGDEILVKLHDYNPNNTAALRAVCEKRERERSLQRTASVSTAQSTASTGPSSSSWPALCRASDIRFSSTSARNTRPQTSRTAPTNGWLYTTPLDETVGTTTMEQKARAGLLRHGQGPISKQVIEERKFAGAEFDRMNQSHNGLLSLDE